MKAHASTRGRADAAGAQSFVPVKVGRRSAEVASQLREAIFARRFQIGDRLPSERALASAFAVSPVVVREAVHALEAVGLLDVRHGATGGAFVTDVTHRPVAESLSALLRLGKATLRQIGEARLVIEPAVAAFAAERRRRDDVVRLARNLDEAAANLESPRAARLLNLEFHKLLVGIVANPFLSVCLTSLIENLEANTDEVDLAPTVVGGTLAHHREIYLAVRTGDGAAATRHMHRHIGEIQRQLERREPRPKARP